MPLLAITLASWARQRSRVIFITITDAVSGNAVAIAVTNKGDGTIGLSGGIATTDGTTTNFEATVAPVSVDQAFKVIQDINKYGNMIA